MMINDYLPFAWVDERGGGASSNVLVHASMGIHARDLKISGTGKGLRYYDKFTLFHAI